MSEGILVVKTRKFIRIGMRNRWNQDMAPLRLKISLLCVLLCIGAQARTFKYNEYIIESKSGNSTCFSCRRCPPGLPLYQRSGTKPSDHNPEIKSEPFVLGKTYSEDEDISISLNHVPSVSDRAGTMNGLEMHLMFRYNSVLDLSSYIVLRSLQV